MYNNLYRQATLRLTPAVGSGEAHAIARFLLEEGFGVDYTDMVCGMTEGVDTALLEEMLKRVEQGEPVQYVVGHTTFCGQRFEVTPAVLIPRPETEELCLWMKECLCDHPRQSPIRMLDIGTGSGCIAITLARNFPQAHVEACDLSTAALAVAERNAELLGADVTFFQTDILNASLPPQPCLNLVVSNPPYICQREKAGMEVHVLDHEPHTALFVPDEDPLVFYRAIARYSLAALKKDGHLFFEINPLYAEDLRRMLDEMGFFCIQIRNDSYGKQRFIHARTGD